MITRSILCKMCPFERINYSSISKIKAMQCAWLQRYFAQTMLQKHYLLIFEISLA